MNSNELAEIYFEAFMSELNIDLSDPNLKDTPARVVRMYKNELFSGLYENEPKITVFPNRKKYDQIINVSFSTYTTCAHHFVPVKVKIHIGYIPKKTLVGISKLVRIAEYYAKRPQIQEELTQQIVKFIDKKLKPNGSICIIEGSHGCMTSRGVNKIDSVMRTSELSGVFRTSAFAKDEFMKLI